MLEILMQWLQTFPEWEDTLQLDYADVVPGNAGLYPRGITELSRREDVLGNVSVHLRCGFQLRRVAGIGEENARWLLNFQNWVARQDALGLCPKFGDEPKTEHIRAFDGKLDGHAQVGSVCYTVQLSVEFTKFYEVK